MKLATFSFPLKFLLLTPIEGVMDWIYETPFPRLEEVGFGA